MPTEDVMGKWRPLTAVCLGTFMLLLDVTVVIVALPDMAGALDASLSDLQWVIDIYALVLAALLLGAGAAADVLGSRRMYVAGIALFAAASLGCGLASGPATLIACAACRGSAPPRCSPPRCRCSPPGTRGGSGPWRSGCGARSAARRRRSARCSAGCSPRAWTGGGSSSSICR